MTARAVRRSGIVRWPVVAAVVGAVVACAPGGGGAGGPGTAAPPASPSPPPAPTASPPPAPDTTTPPARSPTADATPGPVALELVAEGFEAPVQALPSPWGDLLVVELTGRIRRLAADGTRSTYLDLTDRVTTGGERGLLSVVFHPEDDRRLLLHYSGQDGRTTLSRVRASAASADPGSEEVLLTVPQPASNHNGGQLRFGPDGMLYLGLGDGGGAGDRFGNGQRPDTLLGTILRLAVPPDGPYRIPADNPWVAGDDGAPEVWAYGLRNPWRFAFGAGRLYVGDVGQDRVEEVNAVPAGAAGVNYGWPRLEGRRCFRGPDCDPAGTVLPVTTYTHAETDGCAVIGGEVHAGRALPRLRGWFLYSDQCAGFLRAVRVGDDGTVTEADVTPGSGPVPSVLGFGTDAEGETLLTVADGRVLRLVPAG